MTKKSEHFFTPFGQLSNDNRNQFAIISADYKMHYQYRTMDASTQWGVLCTASLLLAWACRWLVSFVRRTQALPPGPWGLPLLGYVPWLGKEPHVRFAQLAKKYGNLFSVTLGTETVVVLNDWLAVKETLVNQPKIFSGRPFSFIFHTLSNGKDIGMTDGAEWKKQRNLTLQILRSLGMGKKSMESRAMDMVHEVLEKFNKANGKIQLMESVFFGPILKVNWHLISGDNVEHSVDLSEFETIVFNIFLALRSDDPVNTFPWLRFLPPDGLGFWKIKRLNDTLLSYLKKVVDEHVAKWTEGTLNDFVDHYLAEMHKQNKQSNRVEPPYNTEHLLYTLWDLFLAGVDSTSSTFLWGFLYLAHNPSIQKKIQEQLDEVVGGHRLPTLGDIPQLSLVDALVMEIHRKSTIVPLALPHRNTHDVQVLGFQIPKNTTFFHNAYAIHHDPQLWDQPEVFKPERFLDENNKAKAPSYLIPFSIGPRLCPGQSLAEMELKLLFSCALQQFNFSLPPGQPRPSFESHPGLVLQPHPYSLHISKRVD